MGMTYNVASNVASTVPVRQLSQINFADAPNGTTLHVFNDDGRGYWGSYQTAHRNNRSGGWTGDRSTGFGWRPSGYIVAWDAEFKWQDSLLMRKEESMSNVTKEASVEGQIPPPLAPKENPETMQLPQYRVITDKNRLASREGKSKFMLVTQHNVSDGVHYRYIDSTGETGEYKKDIIRWTRKATPEDMAALQLEMLQMTERVINDVRKVHGEDPLTLFASSADFASAESVFTKLLKKCKDFPRWLEEFKAQLHRETEHAPMTPMGTNAAELAMLKQSVLVRLDAPIAPPREIHNFMWHGERGEGHCEAKPEDDFLYHRNGNCEDLRASVMLH